MKRSRFSEEQIISILREQESGSSTADMCRKHGVGSATFYKWKATYGCLDVSRAPKLKVLEDENARLNSNSAAARVLEEAKPNSSKDIPMPNGYTPGFDHPELVGTGADPDPAANPRCIRAGLDCR